MRENEVINVKKSELDNQAEEIMRMAEESGLQGNYFFVKTFKNYQVQLKILDELEKAINKDGILVTKEYVKGRKNVYSHPAISDFNRTVDSANKTVSTLIKILKNFNAGEDEDEVDPLLEAINGDDGDEE